MSIEFQCDHCDQLIRVPDESVGHQARCPFCQTVQPVPDPNAPVTPPPAPEFQREQQSFRSQETPPEPPGNTAGNPFRDSEQANPYREDPVNPYAAGTQMPAGGGLANQTNLAPLGDRFLGVVIDYLFVAICLIPGIVMAGIADSMGNEVLEQIGAGLLLLGGLAQVVTQWVLISTRGQSVGKIVMKTRIVTVSGAAPGFVHGVVLRIMLFGLVTTPFCICYPLYPAVPIVDGLFIFGERRQCLHDMLASTYVVSDKHNG